MIYEFVVFVDGDLPDFVLQNQIAFHKYPEVLKTVERNIRIYRGTLSFI